jgi:multiple sugar transport system substrate-binding protein
MIKALTTKALTTKATGRKAGSATARAILLGAGCVAILAGCRPLASGPQEVEFWAIGAEGEKIGPLLEEFHKENPGVRVRLQQIPWSAAHEKLLTAFAGETLPDVCQLGNTWIAEMVALNALEDLTPRVASSPIVAEANYFSGIWACNVIDERVWGIPWYVDTRVLFYRTDLLAAAGYDAPPTSWGAWREMMQQIQQRQGHDRYAILLPTNEWEQPTILGLQTGSTLLGDQGCQGNFSEPSFRRAMQFYGSLFDEGLAPKLPNTRVSNVWQEFARGTFAMYITGPWNVDQFRRRLPAELDDRWDTAPLPHPDETADTPGVSMAGGCSLVMFRGAEPEEAAWQLIEFLSAPEQQARFYKLASDLPAHREAWTTTGLATDDRFDAFHQQLENVRPLPTVPEWEQIAQRVWPAAERIIHGQASVEKSLRQLDAEADEVLEKRRWMLARGSQLHDD